MYQVIYPQNRKKQILIEFKQKEQICYPSKRF